MQGMGMSVSMERFRAGKVTRRNEERRDEKETIPFQTEFDRSHTIKRIEYSFLHFILLFDVTMVGHKYKNPIPTMQWVFASTIRFSMW